MSGNNKDNRMEWILKYEELEKAKEGTPVYFTEYEICSEVRITGVFTYGNGMMECSLYQETDDNGLCTYILKIKHIDKVFEYDADSYSRDGYYFKEGLVGEIIALISFHYQARFYLKATIVGTMSAVNIRIRTENKFLYRKIDNDTTCLNLEMFSSQNRNWTKGGLSEFLDSIRKLDQKYHQKIIQSLHWYSKAIKEVGVDHELFFIKTVSAIEALLDVNEVESDELAMKLSKMNDEGIFDPGEWMQVTRWLKNRNIRRRFTEFFQTYADGFVATVPQEASHYYISQNQIHRYIKRIYDARSAYLHTGKPMFISMDMGGEEMKKWDLDPTLGISIGRRKVSGKEMLPRTRWFERITNYSVKNFMREKLSSE